MHCAGQEVNAAFQGGGARFLYYVGVHEALLKRKVKPKNVAGSSGGALQALFFALGVTPQDYRSLMLHEPGVEQPFGHIDEAQDFIPAKQRQKCLDNHFDALQKFLKKEVRSKAGWFKGLFFDQLIWPQIEGMLDSMGAIGSELVFNLRGKVEKRLVPEMLINGEIVYGQKLVQMIEKLLDKYLSPYIDDPIKRKNITMGEFKDTLGVNLIFTGSDLTSKDLKVLSATSTPNVPVKFACRISTCFPFFYPPVYWQKEWGLYAGSDITGHKLIDGGWMLNLPTALLTSPPYFREKFISPDPIDPDSIIAFSYEMKSEKEASEDDEIQYSSQSSRLAVSVPDVWPPFLDHDYLRAVGRGPDFMQEHCQHPERASSFYDLKIPGFVLMKELLESKKDFQEIFAGDLFFKDTLHIDAGEVQILNFRLDGVNPEEEIKKSARATDAFLDQKLL